MDQPYDRRRAAIRDYVASAIKNGPRGTQAELARRLGAPVQTVNKWAQRSTCPSEQNWPGIEEHFGWQPGTIAGIGGLAEQQLSDLETAIAHAGNLDENGRDAMFAVYRAVRLDASSAPPPTP